MGKIVDEMAADKKETPSKGCLYNCFVMRFPIRSGMTSLPDWPAISYLFSAVATSTAQATVQPTIGLLPMPRNPIISTCAGTDDKPRAEQIHLFCRGEKEEKPTGLNWWWACELCVRVHTAHSVGHSLESECQHLIYVELKPCKPLLYIRILTPSQ